LNTKDLRKMGLDTHVKFFEEVVGVYGEMVYGNTKVIVAKFT